jgi:hypothetical protein
MDPFNLFPQTFMGIRVVESPDLPRYELPRELLPGKDFNRWARSFLGTTNMVPKGTAYMLAGGFAVMRPEDVVKISNLAT